VSLIARRVLAILIVTIGYFLLGVLLMAGAIILSNPPYTS